LTQLEGTLGNRNKVNRNLLIILLFVFLNSPVWSQSDSLAQQVRITCAVKDENGQPLSNLIIINKRTRSGSFGNANGTFSIQCLKTDTLSITSLGYHSRDLSVSDSVFKSEYNLQLYLDVRVYRTGTVEVFAPRDLEKIQADINKLGFNERDYMMSGVDAIKSPVTFLYMQFSKKERSRRLAAELTNEDKKRDLLKELFHHYVDYQIIDLSDEEFDEFIDFLNVSDEFVKSSSQYDFLVYVKERFKDFKVYKRQRKQLRESDFDYDRD
jgi:hypothetical protein